MQLRRPLAGDDGVSAIITAIVASLIFTVAALGVDLAGLIAREAVARNAAEEAALAAAAAMPGPCDTIASGAAGALVADGNAVPDDDGGTPATAPGLAGDLLDGDPVDGEVTFLSDPVDPTSVVSCPGAGDGVPASNVRVVTPQARVDFGFAGILGTDGTSVSQAATVSRRSPLPVMPFAIPAACAAPGPRDYVVSPAAAVGPPRATAAAPVAPVATPGSPDVTLDPASVQLNGNRMQVTATATGSLFFIPLWWAEFTADVAGRGRVQVVSAFPAYADTDGSGTTTVRVDLPPEVSSSYDTWTVRLYRLAYSGSSDARIGGFLPFVVSSNAAVLTLPPPPAEMLCSGPRPSGELLLVSTPDPQAAVTDGLSDPPHADPDGPHGVAEKVRVRDVSGQALDAAAISAGLLARLGEPDPPCPDTGGTWQVTASSLLVATDDMSCFAPVVNGTGDDWSFPATSEILGSPRAVLLPVVDVGPTRPAVDILAPVTGYRLGILTFETPEQVAAAPGAPDCAFLGDTGLCAGLQVAGGTVTRARIHVSDLDAALDAFGPTTLVRDRGHPWVAGPVDLHLTG